MAVGIVASIAVSVAVGIAASIAVRVAVGIAASIAVSTGASSGNSMLKGALGWAATGLEVGWNQAGTGSESGPQGYHDGHSRQAGGMAAGGRWA